jgi:hypothetical protein
MPQITPPIHWRAHEHSYSEKSTDWFWAVGFVTAAMAAISIILGNILFAVVITIGAITLTLQSLKKPRYEFYEVNDRGIRAGDTFYPYSSLDSFWVELSEYGDRLIIESEHFFMPLIVIQIDEAEGNEIRDYLLNYLPEEEHQEPLSHKFLEYLGF